MHKIIYSVLTIALLEGCGVSDSLSTMKARRDAATITITPEGLYDVLCKNGERQLITEADFLADKVCERPPVLCGNYAANAMPELSGNYIVSCNTTIAGQVNIKEGTRLLADDRWSITFNGIQALGTAAKPITFGMSRNATATEWSKIVIGLRPSGPTVFNPKDGYVSGSRLSHVNFSAVQGNLSLNNLYANNITIANADQVDLNGVYFTESDVNSSRMTSQASSNPSYLIRNKLKLNLLYANNEFDSSLLSFNTIESPGYLRFENSLLVFNDISKVSSYYFCNASNSGDVVANKFDNTEIIGCLGDHRRNTTNELPDVDIVANFPIKRFTVSSLGKSTPFQFLALDRNEFRFDQKIQVEAQYKIDGALYKYDKAWEGFSPEIAIEEKESYDIVPSIVGSSRPYVLSFDRIILDVY